MPPASLWLHTLWVLLSSHSPHAGGERAPTSCLLGALWPAARGRPLRFTDGSSQTSQVRSSRCSGSSLSSLVSVDEAVLWASGEGLN